MIKYIIKKLFFVLINISPFSEVLMRKVYWNNISRTSKFRPKQRNSNTNFKRINFNSIIDNLKNRGIGNGSTIVVHSSYDLLEASGLLPEEINSKLLELVGTDGTLVMPVIRKYKEEGNFEKHIIINMDSVECTYNVQKSKIVSGLLPYMLMQRHDSFVSRFPLNPVVAVGKHAKKMIEKNLEGDKPTPHGPNSAWKYCVDNNAIVIGLGVDMPHFLTITHVNEECSEDWPIKNWYRNRKFIIIDKGFKAQKEVLERKPIWGSIYLAENKYRKDLIRNDIMKIETVEGLKISMIESNKLIHYLHNHSQKGYPYYVRSKFLI